MALLFTESFGEYSAFADFAKYGISSTISIGTDTIDATGGYNGLPAYKSTANSSGLVTLENFPQVIAPASNELRFGFWFKVTSGATHGTNSSWGSVAFWDSSLSHGMGVKLSSTERIGWFNLKSVAPGGVDYSGATAINDGQHHWIEGRVVLSGSNGGTVQIWVDGILEINQTGVTNNGGFGLDCTNMTRVSVGGVLQTNTASQWLSHVMVWDTSGSTFNGYMGPMYTQYLAPNGAGTNSGLTPTAGANYTNVNEQVINQDTNYVEAATSGTKDTYAYADLGTSPNIAAVMAKSYAKNPDIGTKTFRNICLSSAAYANGADQTLAVAYKLFVDAFYTDPNTGAAWTASGLNAAEFGVETRT